MNTVGSSLRFLALAAFLSFVLSSSLFAREAKYFETLPDGSVQCGLCPRECTLAGGQTGYCRVRRNVGGKLTSRTYGKLCSMNVDPVEKKPLFHFLPGSRTFSVASAGCNLRCSFCQNWTISQADPDEVQAMAVSPGQLVAAAKGEDCPSISYTYSEPTTFIEYMTDAGVLARREGLRNIWVTSGYINPKPAAELAGVLDAANVDLKGFSDESYRKMAGAKLAPVLETLKVLKSRGVWLEVGYLVIPTVNDDPAELTAFVQWVAKNLGPDVPVHFLRFFPRHRLTSLPPTPVPKLEEAHRLAKEAGLRYVYIGNVPGHPAANTYCPRCGKTVIERKGFFSGEVKLKDGKCPFCGAKIAGVWR